MKELVTAIILFVIVRLSSYGAWNVRSDKNKWGAVGVGILCLAIIFELGTFMMDLM